MSDKRDTKIWCEEHPKTFMKEMTLRSEASLGNVTGVHDVNLSRFTFMQVPANSSLENSRSDAILSPIFYGESVKLRATTFLAFKIFGFPALFRLSWSRHLPFE